MAWRSEEEEDWADAGALGERRGLIQEDALGKWQDGVGEQAGLHGVRVGVWHQNLDIGFNITTIIQHSRLTRLSLIAWACTIRPGLLFLTSRSETLSICCPMRALACRGRMLRTCQRPVSRVTMHGLCRSGLRLVTPIPCNVSFRLPAPGPFFLAFFFFGTEYFTFISRVVQFRH